MRVCVPSLDPGGFDGFVATSFEDADVFDFYELQPSGTFERIAQTRPCTCTGPNQVEVVSRRCIDAIVVTSLSPNALLLFTNAGVKVFRSANLSIDSILDSYAKGSLEQIRMIDFPRLKRTS